ncbi:MAG: hypothetical protein U9Q63_03535 [Patescibacteria group bacterium]|nr:hypothetical protein [Patescibacteria group bacterium]
MSVECLAHQLPVKGNKKIELAIKEGRLVCTTDMFCDHRLPPFIEMAEGEDISCVGPDDPACPHPNSASVG